MFLVLQHAEGGSAGPTVARVARHLPCALLSVHRPGDGEPVPTPAQPPYCDQPAPPERGAVLTCALCSGITQHDGNFNVNAC